MPANVDCKLMVLLTQVIEPDVLATVVGGELFVKTVVVVLLEHPFAGLVTVNT
jgi:hypothetical protein